MIANIILGSLSSKQNGLYSFFFLGKESSNPSSSNPPSSIYQALATFPTFVNLLHKSTDWEF